MVAVYGIVVPWRTVLDVLKVNLPNDEKQVNFPMPHVLDALSKCQQSIFSDYNVYNVGNSFLLFSVDQVEDGIDINAHAGYGGGCDPLFGINLKVTPVTWVPTSADDALVELASAFSTDGRLSFRPGLVTISTSGDVFPIDQLFSRIEPQESSTSISQRLLEKRIPTDVTLVIGRGKLEHNTNILTHYGLKALLECIDPITKRGDLSEHGFTMDDLEKAVIACTQREQFPPAGSGESEDASGNRLLNSLDDKLVALIKRNAEHPQDNNSTPPQDCVFVVGTEELIIEANRAVLANSNQVLSRILYGTDLMAVRPENPIKWPDFSPDAVSLVFCALTQLPGSSTVIPIGMEAEFRLVLDFLGETDKSVSAHYAMFSGAKTEASLTFDPCWSQYQFICEPPPDLLGSIQQGGEDWIVYKTRTMA